MSPADREQVVIGRMADFPVGSQKVVAAGALEIGVYNVGGTLHAIRNYCPHRGARICEGLFGGTFLPSHPDEARDEVILKGCSDCRIVFMVDPEWKNWDDCRECGHSLKTIYSPGIGGPDPRHRRCY